MTFDAPFSRVFLPPFGPALASGAAAEPWYLSGGIASANCVAAYQAKGVADIAASYVNLANPGTYNASNGNAPSFNTATGWTFDGVNNYLKTGVTPVNDQSYSAIVRFSGYDTSKTSRLLFGVYTANYAGRLTIQPYTSALRSDHANGGNKIYTFSYTSGVICVAGNALYINGALIAGAIPTGGNAFSSPMYIGAINELQAAAGKYAGSISRASSSNASSCVGN